MCQVSKRSARMGLADKVGSAGASGPARLAAGAIKTKFINTLARIWYNFDGLKTAQKRVYREKNLGRLRRDIETLTNAVVDETEFFLETCRSEAEARARGGSAASDAPSEVPLLEVADRYGELIGRLNL